MPFKIQRVPRGLQNLLTISTGEGPIELEDRVRPTVDLLQFYALQQRQILFQSNGAVAELGEVSALTAANSRFQNGWAVLFGASFVPIKTATMTALRVTLQMHRSGSANSAALAAGELGPFGATETGPASLVFFAPYPVLLVPPWDVFGRVEILGTDATVSCTAIAEIGVIQ